MKNPEASRGMEESAKPERLVPIHLSGEIQSNTQSVDGPQKELTPQELYEKRAKSLDKAPDLESKLRKHLENNGQNVPENVNLSLVVIEEFQRHVREAQDLRKVIKHTQSAKEKRIALGLYTHKKAQIEEYLQLGPSFEAGYREYIRSRNEYIQFNDIQEEIRQLDKLLTEPAFKELDDEAQLDQRAYGRIEALVRQTVIDDEEQQNREAAMEALKTVYPEGSPEYDQMMAEIQAEFAQPNRPRTKKELADQVHQLRGELVRLWENPMVRYFSNVKELENMMGDYHEGKAVLETQTVVKNLNKLHEWEEQHQRTTIGGVLVGPPGGGKTTLVRHYLEAKDRGYTYIDLSEDVTRYLLYGSKSIEFKSPVEYYERLTRDLKGLDESAFRMFIERNSAQLKDTFGLSGDEAAVVLVKQIEDELNRAGELQTVPKEMAAELAALRGKINTIAKTAHLKELATEFAHIVKRNGWRDGMVIAALRRGDSIIFDEFNKNKNWSLIYSLMTAQPGENWYFADNDESIKIPNEWRMYFTANIGTRHGGYNVAEALASRAGGKVIEIGYPQIREELLVATTALSNPEGDFLRSNEDLAKLYVLIHDVFPGMRKYLEDRKQTIPISFRTIRDIAEKLVLSHDPKTKVPVYKPTAISFDEALYEVLIDSYALYEDKQPPKEWVKTLTSLGLLLDDKVKDRVIEWIGEADFQERRAKFEGMKEDFQQVAAKIQGLTRSMGADMPIPEQVNF